MSTLARAITFLGLLATASTLSIPSSNAQLTTVKMSRHTESGLLSATRLLNGNRGPKEYEKLAIARNLCA